jgi:xylose isomerase
VNIQVNHATLAGRNFGHRIIATHSSGVLGSIDMNRDKYVYAGMNSDTEAARQSIHPQGVFHAYINQSY